MGARGGQKFYSLRQESAVRFRKGTEVLSVDSGFGAGGGRPRGKEEGIKCRFMLQEWFAKASEKREG